MPGNARGVGYATPVRAAVLLVLLATATAHAESPTSPWDAPIGDSRDDAKPAISQGRRALAIAAAIFPGVIVHGAGAWVLGDHATAKRLLVSEAVGLGAVVVGGVPVQYSGSNPYTIIPEVPLVVAGMGVNLGAWFTDIWVASGGRSDAPAIARAPWAVDVATTWLHAPYHDRALLAAAGHVDFDRYGADALGYASTDNASRMAELDARWQFLGAPAPANGSRLYVRVAGRYERADDDDVTELTGEAELIGRLDMAELGDTMRGSFVELSTGGGVQRTTYAKDRHDTDSLLLGTFAWGAYLGDRGEAKLFYDHRRDGLAGGIAAWRAAGFVGSVGAAADVRIVGPWMVRGQVQVGNAWVATLGLRYLGRQR